MRKSFFVILAAVLLIMTSCEKEVIRGSGETKTEKRSLDGFDKVLLEIPSEVTIEKGNEFDLEIKAYSNLLPYIETYVENSALHIRYKNSAHIRNDNARIYITLPQLSAIESYGSGSIACDGTFNSTQLDAVIRGSGNITLGNALIEEMKVDISGSGSFKGFTSISRQADIFINGSGNAEISVMDKMSTTINGSGNIYYKGDPIAIENNIRGSGKVVKQQ